MSHYGVKTGAGHSVLLCRAPIVLTLGHWGLALEVARGDSRNAVDLSYA